jgi:3-oxoacyl-[acyl-carrier-protein] synthase-3
MRYDHVHIESFGRVLPERVVTSLELEERLAPLYDRLRLSAGRLELSSGIRERRFWESGTRPSTVAAAAGRDALERCGLDPSRIGCLVHASVCRDFLEPASASIVHHALGLPPQCTAFDLSNACLGFANAMTVIAGQIERGEIEAGLVVAGESGGPLVEETLRALTESPSVGRRELKRAHASLTIGSGAAAAVLVHESLATNERRLLGSVALADTSAHTLCSGDLQSGREGPLMETDSEALLAAGNELAASTWQRFLEELGWTAADVERVVTHQVGSAHRRLLFETLELDPALDFPTVETLGNTGSVALPLSYALGEEAGFIRPGQRTALLGIGSGLHCQMLAVRA